MPKPEITYGEETISKLLKGLRDGQNLIDLCKINKVNPHTLWLKRKRDPVLRERFLKAWREKWEKWGWNHLHGLPVPKKPPKPKAWKARREVWPVSLLCLSGLSSMPVLTGISLGENEVWVTKYERGAHGPAVALPDLPEGSSPSEYARGLRRAVQRALRLAGLPHVADTISLRLPPWKEPTLSPMWSFSEFNAFMGLSEDGVTRGGKSRDAMTIGKYGYALGLAERQRLPWGRQTFTGQQWSDDHMDHASQLIHERDLAHAGMVTRAQARRKRLVSF
jgi:hypothetical protein